MISMYATAHGHIQLPNQAALDKAIGLLLQDGYLSLPDHYDSASSPTQEYMFSSDNDIEGHDVVKGLCITIPMAFYRGLLPIMSDVLELASNGEFYWFVSSEDALSIGSWVNGEHREENDPSAMADLSNADERSRDALTMHVDEWDKKYASDADSGDDDFFAVVDSTLSFAARRLPARHLKNITQPQNDVAA